MSDSVGASQVGTQQISPQLSGRGGLWPMTTIVAVICAAAALLFAVWFFATSYTIRKEVTRLQDESSKLDKQITDANNLNGLEVESRAQELVSTISRFQKVIDGKKIWSKAMPAIAGSTLKGVTLNGLSIDEKLSIKIDGSSAPITYGSESITPYGLVARQVVAYRDAKDSALASDTKKTNETSVFSNVTLNSISESTKHDENANIDQVTAKFSISLTLNPKLVASVAATKKVTQ